MDRRIQVGQCGALVLPPDMLAKYNIHEGGTLYLLDLNGVFVLTPMAPLVPELAREIERLRLEAGLSTTELLQGLREQRAKYRAEDETNVGQG
jgi:hypothetical protein